MRLYSHLASVFGFSLLATAAFAQAGGEKGPERIVWAAQKTPELVNTSNPGKGKDKLPKN